MRGQRTLQYKPLKAYYEYSEVIVPSGPGEPGTRVVKAKLNTKKDVGEIVYQNDIKEIVKGRFDNYKFRASCLGKLMVRKMKGQLSLTTQSYLKDIYIKEVYGRERDLSNKYMDKGNYAEQTDSLDILSDHYSKLILSKDLNSEPVSNKFMTGTPDILKIKDLVIDIKSSWSMHTFFEADGRNKDYEWQGWAYMWMTKRKKFDLAYCLANAPLWMVENEHRKKMYNFKHIEGTDEYEEISQYWENYYEKNMLFDDLDMKKRIKVFTFDFDKKLIPEVEQRIEECRHYLNTLSF